MYFLTHRVSCESVLYLVDETFVITTVFLHQMGPITKLALSYGLPACREGCLHHLFLITTHTWKMGFAGNASSHNGSRKKSGSSPSCLPL